MFHRLLIPIKPEPKLCVALGILARQGRADDARLISVAIEVESDIVLSVQSGALAIDVMHVRDDRADAALRWIREQRTMKELAVETLLVKGTVVHDAVLEVANEKQRCDAIVLTHRKTAWPAPPTGYSGDQVIRNRRFLYSF